MADEPSALMLPCWGQWRWKDTGRGRWHVIVDGGPGKLPDGRLITVVHLACGRVRRLPTTVQQHRPERDHCCSTCLALDDLRAQYATDHDRAPVTEEVLV